MKNIIKALIVGVGIIALINYLPRWLDKRTSNETRISGAAKFFSDIHSWMIRAVPIKDDLGIAQNAVWTIAFSLVAWLALRRFK